MKKYAFKYCLVATMALVGYGVMNIETPANAAEQELKVEQVPTGIANSNLKLKAAPQRVVVMPPPASKPIERVSTRSVNLTGSGCSYATHGNNQPSANMALSGFDLRFLNGDHKIRQISVLQEDNVADFAFADSNSDDPFSASATWMKSEAFIPGEIIATGGGDFVLELPTPPVGYTPVLKGFSFRRADNNDANVRTIGLRIRPQSNSVRAILIDDQGMDLRSVNIGPGRSGGGTSQNFTGTYDNIQTAMRHVNRGDLANGQRQFAVVVQYVWVPNSMIEQRYTSESTDGIYWMAPANRYLPYAALQGFLFNFGRSDHHLSRTFVNFYSQSSNGNLVDLTAGYNENRTNDPKTLTLDYVSLRE